MITENEIELEYIIIDVIRDELDFNSATEYHRGKSIFIDSKTIINLASAITKKCQKVK